MKVFCLPALLGLLDFHQLVIFTEFFPHHD